MIQKTYLKTKGQCKVKFSWKDENAQSVEVYGLNNDWDSPVAMTRKKDGTFTCEVSLPKNSSHEFKYRVNNTDWLNDPEADSEKANEFGGSNSVIDL